MPRAVDWYVLLALLGMVSWTAMAQDAPQDDPVHWTGAEILGSDLSFDDKLSALNQQLVLNPQNPELYNNLGVLYADYEQWPLARDAFVRAVQADPRNAANHRNLGQVFVHLGETNMAIMEFEAYQGLAADGAFDAPLLIGDAWENAAEPDRAESVYRDALDTRTGVYDEIIAQLVVRYARILDTREDLSPLAALLETYVDHADADIASRGGADADEAAGYSATIVERLVVMWIQDARNLAVEGNHAQAAELYERIQAYDSDRPDLLSKIAESWLDAGDPMKAKVIAQRAVTEDPDNPSGWKAKGRIADKQGQTRDALAAYEKVFELDPSQLDVAARIGQLYMVIGDNTSARRYMGVVASNPDTPVDLLYNYALSLQREDEFPLSVGPLKKVVERAPTMVPAWRALGSAYRHDGKFSQAEDAYSEALALEPDPRTAFQVGFCATRAGHLDTAVSAYRAATDLDPTYDKAWYNLALAEIRVKDYEAALADLEVLGMLEGDLYRVYFNQGICYANLGKSDEALEAYEMALDIKETAAAWTNMGVVFQNLGKNKDAARCFKIGKELKGK